MNCADIDRLLSQGRTTAELRAIPAAQVHIDACPHCAALLNWDAAPIPAPAVSAPSSPASNRSCMTTSNPSPRYRPSGPVSVPRWLWPPSSPPSPPPSSAPAAGFRLPRSNSRPSSPSPSWPSAPRRPASGVRSSPGPATRFPLLTILLFPNGPNQDFLVEGGICLTVGLLFAAVAAAVYTRVARRGHATDPRRTGALTGAVSVLTGDGLLPQPRTSPHGHLAQPGDPPRHCRRLPNRRPPLTPGTPHAPALTPPTNSPSPPGHTGNNAPAAATRDSQPPVSTSVNAAPPPPAPPGPPCHA